MVIIDGFEIDAVVNSSHGFENEVTEYPVETGSDVADHVRARPVSLQINGVVSDTPIGALAERRTEGGRPSDNAFNRLLRIRDSREPIVVETDLKTYQQMVLTRLSAPRDSRTGDSFRFRAEFVQIRLVQNERTAIRVSVPRAAKKENVGHKPPVRTGFLLLDEGKAPKLGFSPIYFASKGFAGGAGGSF